MKLLAMCYPTWGQANDIQLNSTNEYIVLATDEIFNTMSMNGIDVDIVSLKHCDKPFEHPLMRSRTFLKRLEDIKFDEYDVYFHTFRDPTQPEVISMLTKLNFDYKGKPVLNDAFKLALHSKWSYIPIFQKHGIGPKIVSREEVGNNVKWGEPTYSAQVSSDKKYIMVGATNNNRGDYPERRERENVILSFIDNASGGIRSFFRIGYSMGKPCQGWLYASDDKIVAQKSGSCKHRTPFQLTKRHSEKFSEVMKETGIDMAHVEGCFIEDQMYLFDINPYPTAHGGTLTPITEDMVDKFFEHFKIEKKPIDRPIMAAPKRINPPAQPAQSIPLPPQPKITKAAYDFPPEVLNYQWSPDMPPCMTQEEANWMLHYFLQRKPKRVLEYGIGGSTANFSNLPFIEEWIGIEHNQDWVDKVGIKVSNKVKLYFHPLSKVLGGSEGYGSPEYVNGYASAPEIVGKFDFVFIDGDYRHQCMQRIPELLTPNGYVMIHDTARKSMHQFFNMTKFFKVLTEGELNNANDWHQGLTVMWNE